VPQAEGKREHWRPPRGRHRLPAEVIARSQRERLLEAAVRVVAEKGYGRTTVADLTREAGISRTTFYAMYEDKEACFLAAYDNLADALVKRIASAYEGEEPWPERARAGLSVLLEALAEEPALARLALVDVGAAGPAAQRRYRAALQRLTPLFDEGRDFAPAGRSLPANTSRMAIGAVVGLISDELAEGRAEYLRSLLLDLLFAALVPYIGPAAAAREVGEASCKRLRTPCRYDGGTP
jgi:AcrR family transcriptional regulator